ncbi:hypothetical protein EN807_16435 [Mesorhizobium sp. M5C.F.Ca.ET.164.01.1.1]|nr:hypothetical protein EN807_16435 [Mesorhizobium sp. M5C.F.Ca.ET.164.01.1.1]
MTTVVFAECLSRIVGIISAALDDKGIIYRPQFAERLMEAAEGTSDDISRGLLVGLAEGIAPPSRPKLTVVKEDDPNGQR